MPNRAIPTASTTRNMMIGRQQAKKIKKAFEEMSGNMERL